jgi:hypothetical protein
MLVAVPSPSGVCSGRSVLAALAILVSTFLADGAPKMTKLRIQMVRLPPWPRQA